MQDLRLAVRALRAPPVVTIVAVLSLALGIGANAAIFSLINGVMPPTFVGLEVGRVLDVAMPYRLAARFTSTPFDDDTQWHNIMVRLKPGLSVDDASARLRSLQPQLRLGAMPKTPRADFLQDPLTLTAASSGVSALRQRFETPLLVIFVVVVLVLLVACANIGNLLLARGLARRHEFSIRVSLGASRARLIRQLVIESLVLTASGACLGLAIAPAASRLLVLLLSTTRVPIALDLSLDWRVIAFTIAITLITAVLCGTAPAFRASQVAPGILLGIVISVWASTFVASLMYGVDPRDPATLAAAVLVLSVVGALAASLPAWRASRIDPTQLLRATE